MTVPTTLPWPRKFIPNEFSFQPKTRKFYPQVNMHMVAVAMHERIEFTIPISKKISLHGLERKR